MRLVIYLMNVRLAFIAYCQSVNDRRLSEMFIISFQSMNMPQVCHFFAAFAADIGLIHRKRHNQVFEANNG